MAITHIDSTQAQNGATSTTFACNVPAGVLDGDVLIAFAWQSTTSALSAPAGWTSVAASIQDSTDTHTMEAWYRIASSEPANYTWTGSGTSDKWVTQTALRGGEPNAPHASASNFDSTVNTTFAGPATVNITKRGMSLIAVGSQIATSGFSPPAGYTTQETLTTSNANYRGMMATKPEATIGNVGGQNYTHTGTDTGVVVHVVVAELPTQILCMVI
jgi:hypothetical protein